MLVVDVPSERVSDPAAAGVRAPSPAPARPTLVSLEEKRRQYIEEVLRHTAGQVAGRGGAADILRLRPSTLRSRMKKLGLR